MKILRNYLLPLIVGTSLLSGCAGYDRALFVTKTNIGLDIEDQPPTAEITIARRELAIAPTYRDTIEGEKTLPLLASFGLTGGFFNPEITSQFAGGDAAVTLANGGEEVNTDSSLCLDNEPDTAPLWKKWFGIKQRDTRPFYFATDTSFGLKVAWNGTGGPYPTNLKLGYNRKELAFPPLFVKEGCDEDGMAAGTRKEGKGPWQVKVPSFFASLDNSSTLASPTESGVAHVQFFATGEAASKFVARPEVNRMAFEQMAPKAANLANFHKNLFEDIKQKYEKNENNRSKILEEAKKLNLVTQDTNEETFLKALEKNIKTVIPEAPVNLLKLRIFVESV